MTQRVQHWQGFVLEVGPETFWARICPFLGDSRDFDVEIYRSYLDHYIPQVGDMFEWKIWYEGNISHSCLYFLPFETWTDEEIEEAEKKAEVWRVSFSDEDTLKEDNDGRII